MDVDVTFVLICRSIPGLIVLERNIQERRDGQSE